jgi:ribosomal protein S12 methylthiotransferase accessory factor
VFSEEQCIRASARELGRGALDLDRIPRCSERELSHPRCPLAAPDTRAPIRWVRGLSLADGRPVHLPAVMVFLSAGAALPGERICLPITTGCAAHTSYERALVSGLLEVIERDAISLTWLQKLPLPRLDIDVVPSPLVPCWERYERSSPELEYLFLDATTDLGIPTVYGIQIARASEEVRTLVACAADFDPARAVAKVICDMASGRLTFRQARPVPDDWDRFSEVHHGAAFMARADQAQAFDFLLRSNQTRALSRMARLDAADDVAALRLVLDRLRRRELEAFAADVSSDEALRAGLRVIRALVPGLQPLSFHYRARYLGHPRLYDAPRAMGHAVRQELQVNHWPQPFS